MKFRLFSWALAGLLLVSFTTVWAEDKAEDKKADDANAAKLKKIEETFEQTWKKHKSMTADLTMTMDMSSMGMGEMKGNGKVAFMNKDGKEMTRMEMTTQMQMGEQIMKSQNLTVTDGEFAYTMQEQMGQKQAFKDKLENAQGSPVGSDMFESMRKQHDLKYAGEEKVDGKDAWVIEATPRAASMSPMKVMKIYINKNNCMLTRFVGVNDSGNELMVMKFENIKLDEKVDPAQFKFTAPEGVNVIDRTGA